MVKKQLMLRLLQLSVIESILRMSGTIVRKVIANVYVSQFVKEKAIGLALLH